MRRVGLVGAAVCLGMFSGCGVTPPLSAGAVDVATAGADDGAADVVAVGRDAVVAALDAGALDVGVSPSALVDAGMPSTGDAGRGRDAVARDALARDVSPAVDGGGGAVRVLREGCDGPAGPLPGTTCRTLEVRCGGGAPAEVVIRVSPPAAGVAARGVVVFGSGGAGTGLWSGPAPANAMMTRLRAAGFTLIERQWLGARDQGWFYDPAGPGVPAVACRYATLVRYLDATYRTGAQPLCATGNSGGSAELVFAITRQDAAEVLDLAVPSSGPFHRMDLACDGVGDAAWQTSCRALLRTHCPRCSSRACSLGPGVRQLIDTAYGASTPCSGITTPVDPTRLRADSPVAPEARLRLPQTRVALLIGEADDGPYAALSSALFEALRAAGTEVSFGSAATGHEFVATDAGAETVERVILSDCVRRH